MIVASDGLFDNLYDDEIMEEVQNCIDQQQPDVTSLPIQAISDALAFRAKVVSEDPDNPTSPFQVRAMHEGLYYQVTPPPSSMGRYFFFLPLGILGWESRRYQCLGSCDPSG